MAYDRYNADMLIAEIGDIAPPDFVVPFGQGTKSMSPALKEIEGLVFNHELEHGGDPVLRWMCDNMVVVTNDRGDIAPSKGKSTEKIDGMVALIMAVDRAKRHGSPESVYEGRALLEFG